LFCRPLEAAQALSENQITNTLVPTFTRS